MSALPNPVLRAVKTAALIRGYAHYAPAGAFCFAQVAKPYIDWMYNTIQAALGRLLHGCDFETPPFLYKGACHLEQTIRRLAESASKDLLVIGTNLNKAL